VRRELEEELRFTPADVADARCIGLIEDGSLRQPELVFAVRSTRSRREVEAMVDAGEHHACVAVEATREGLEVVMRDPLLTPVAVGTLALWGRGAFGDAWFVAHRAALDRR
jgi:hypothetical protein